jgi:imidazolonepropionase-like amidohydrolase/Tol biopolymer transport system component
MRLLLLTAAAFALSAPTLAQTPPKPAEPPKWDVNAPAGATVRQVPIDVTEGSWMDLDVSPDGRTIAFSLLGDIYTLPIAGGTATRIAEGLAWEHQPRFSPDGRRIAFTSDRGGGDNIWVMNADGADKRQVTKEDFRLLNQPSWSPDGQFIAAKKHFTTQRSLGTGEIWLYHVSGGGGAVLVKRPNEQHQKELGEPAFAPDGSRIYFTRNITPGPIFEYAQDSNTDLFNIESVELATGEVSTVVSGAGGAVRPTPSPDGKRIAFVRRERQGSTLWVKDLVSGEERRIYDRLDRDMQEVWAVMGVYPNLAWMPDGRSLVFWAGGKLRRIDAGGGEARDIAFRVADSRGVIDPQRPEIAVAPDRFETKMARFAALSPDGKTLVFETLGKLWLKSAAGGAARRLTGEGGTARELWPAWSRDGRSLAYVRWTDAGLGRIRVVAAGGGGGRDVTATPGHYALPVFSPDGRTIAFEKRRGGYLTSGRWSEAPGVYRVSAAGGAIQRVAKDMGRPQFGASNDRLFMVGQEKGKAQLVSTDLAGEAQRVHATGELASDFRVSPDGRWLAFQQNYEAHAMPLLPGPQDLAADPKGTALPTVRASRGGADYLHWSSPTRLGWSLGPSFFSADTSAMFRDRPGDAPAFVPPTTGVALGMTVAADKPAATLALVGARVVTMAAADGGILDDAVVLVSGDRIAAVGPRAAVAIPPGAQVIDVAGRTIIPGLVDAHAHGPMAAGDLIPEQNWSAVANLALGTTTQHDPSNNSTEVFAAAEYQRAGLLLGPRIFSTGRIVYGAKAPGYFAEVNSLDDALDHVRRLKRQGAHAIKNYNQPRREQRQMVAEAGRREGIMVVAEGGALFGQGLNLIADGNTTLEHNLPIDIFYKDVLDFIGQSRSGYTPTLVVTFGGLGGDPYWRQKTEVFAQPLLMAHTPPALLAESIRRVTAPEDEFADAAAAREAQKLAKRGVPVSIGAHGQQAGIGPHWELWSFVRGGMTPVEALAAGTIVAARSLGMAKDVGSLEAGKLADLVVLDADPTVDIRNSEKVRQVMLGGRLYEAASMDEVAPRASKRPAHWWVAGGGGAGVPAAADATD